MASERRYRMRWRDDAAGFVAGFAGAWASPDAFTRDYAERIRREMPNGDHIEIVEVDHEDHT